MLALKIGKISSSIPLFINHDSARLWFKQQFGSHFAMVDSTVINDVKFYIYHLVHDKLTYVKSMNAIREGSPFIHHNFKKSYTLIEISEHGYIYIME